MLIHADDCGLRCESGGFHIDPWRPVHRAVITHAHADHAVWGCGAYLASPTGAVVLRERLGPDARIETLAWGRRLRLGDVEVSLHPAGHILGSAQVRVERVAGASGADEGGVWVVSGDYKDRPDATCEPLEVVACDTFLTESTFGLPIYRWPDERGVFGQINEWWRANAALGRTSIAYAYALGKAQRVLAGVDPSIGPLGVHGALLKINGAYEANGVSLPGVVHVNDETVQGLRGRGLIVAPPSAGGVASWVRRLEGPDGVSEAFVSGWMRVRGARRWRSVDRGFVLSDHADWPGLLETIERTGASRVGVTHGYSRPLARWLAGRGLDTFVVDTRFEGELDLAADPGNQTDSGGTPGTGEA